MIPADTVVSERSCDQDAQPYFDKKKIFNSERIVTSASKPPAPSLNRCGHIPGDRHSCGEAVHETVLLQVRTKIGTDSVEVGR